MAISVGQTFVTSVDVSTQMAKAGISGSVKDIARSFYDTLQSLIIDYANPTKEMVIDGVKIPLDQKYTYLGTYMMTKKSNDLTSMFDTSLNLYNSVLDMEKQLTKAA
ncbi:MAG: hypothetical protein NT030_08410 [Candidatus Saganbacteria bacterium]|nr:hypothetical protein [Candidatus Saganbacteria bacterium]